MPNPKTIWLILNLQTDYERFFRVGKSDTVIDVFANIAGFTVRAAKVVGSEGVVIAIEPEPLNLFSLKAILAVNEITNVRIIEKAVQNGEGSFKLYLSNNCNIGRHSLLGRGTRIIEILTSTLDDIIKELRITRIDFLKMDIEGAELEALQGASKTLECTLPK